MSFSSAYIRSFFSTKNKKSPHYKLFEQTKSFAWTPGGAGGRWKIVRLMPWVQAKLNHI